MLTLPMPKGRGVSSLADVLMTKDFLGTEEVREVLLSSAEN